MTKYLLLGYGSIGKRHAANLRALRPGCHIIVADPFTRPNPGDGFTLYYSDWARAVSDHADANGAIIASPTTEHHSQAASLAMFKIAFYLEKPVVPVGELSDFGAGVTKLVMLRGQACAVGYQYRFHPAMPRVRALAERRGRLDFVASDDLLGKYGPDVGGSMAAHPIDTALWLLGPAEVVSLVSDGVTLEGHIEHMRGTSSHRYRMNGVNRQSWVEAGGEVIHLPPNNEMYRDALGAWLDWVEGGERDPRTATLADGLAGVRVLAQVRGAST